MCLCVCLCFVCVCVCVYVCVCVCVYACLCLSSLSAHGCEYGASLQYGVCVCVCVCTVYRSCRCCLAVEYIRRFILYMICIPAIESSGIRSAFLQYRAVWCTYRIYVEVFKRMTLPTTLSTDLKQTCSPALW